MMTVPSQDGTTALLQAGRLGHPEAAKLLLAAGADLNAKDIVGGGYGSSYI